MQNLILQTTIIKITEINYESKSAFKMFNLKMKNFQEFKYFITCNDLMFKNV